jgi:hypothetical protein
VDAHILIAGIFDKGHGSRSRSLKAKIYVVCFRALSDARSTWDFCHRLYLTRAIRWCKCHCAIYYRFHVTGSRWWGQCVTRAQCSRWAKELKFKLYIREYMYNITTSYFVKNFYWFKWYLISKFNYFAIMSNFKATYLRNGKRYLKSKILFGIYVKICTGNVPTSLLCDSPLWRYIRLNLPQK